MKKVLIILLVLIGLSMNTLLAKGYTTHSLDLKEFNKPKIRQEYERAANNLELTYISFTILKPNYKVESHSFDSGYSFHRSKYFKVFTKAIENKTLYSFTYTIDAWDGTKMMHFSK